MDRKLSRSYIKEHLKKYGAVKNIDIYEIKIKLRAKAYLKWHKYLKTNSEEIWMTPLGTETTRVIFTKEELTDREINEVLIERNKHSARLLGTNRIFSSLVARALIGTEAKTCYVPKNPYTLKKQNFTVVCFTIK